MEILENMRKKWSEFKKNKENKLIEELLAKIKVETQKRNEQIQNQPANLDNKEYHGKLNDLVQSEIEQKDQFINWVTGIAAAGMFFIFTEVPDLTCKAGIQNTHILGFLINAGVAFLLTIIFALIFKYFSEVKYQDLKLEVEMMGITLTGDEATTEMKKKMSNSVILKFLKNFKRMLDLTSPVNLQKIEIKWKIDSWVLEISYYITQISYIPLVGDSDF